MSSLTRFGGRMWAKDYELDSTGATDMSIALNDLVNNVMEPGDTFEFDPGGYYWMNTQLDIVSKMGLRFIGNNAILFQTAQNNRPVVQINSCQDVEFRDLSVVGHTETDWTGAQLTAIVGTPTINGSTMELNALDEAVQAWNFAAGEPMMLGRNHLGQCKVTVNAKDSAQVGSDFAVQLLHPLTGAVVAQLTQTLTGSNADYTLTHTIVDIETPYLINFKKLTATANTITINSVRVYGCQGYNVTYEANCGFNVYNSTDVKLLSCRVEQVGGDGYQSSTARSSNIVLDHFMSRQANRQGVSANYNRNIQFLNTSIVGAGRKGVDIEPYSTNWVTKNLTVKNMRIIWAHQGGFYMGNWGMIYDVIIDGLYVQDSVSHNSTLVGSFNVAARRGLVSNVAVLNEWKTIPAGGKDGYIYGTGMVQGTQFACPRGYGSYVLPFSTLDETFTITIDAEYPSLLEDRRTQTIAYAATITPDPFLGSRLYTTLTGNVTFAAPGNMSSAESWRGQRLTIQTTQDATGGRTHTWNAIYKGPNAGAPTAAVTTANKVNRWDFEFDGVASWIETNSVVGV